MRTDVHKDERFAMLGDCAGYNRYEALGRMHALWSWCVDRGLQDAPAGEDGYVVSEAVVRRFLGSNGVTAILGDDCDELALGERRDGARIYLRGTSEYVADRRARAAVAAAGGVARAAGGRDDTGRFVPQPTNAQPGLQPEASGTPAAAPAAVQPTPASSSSSSPSGSQNSHPPRVHALPAAPMRYDGSTAAIAALVDRTFRELSDARVTIAGELAIANVLPFPMRQGTPSESRGCRDLRDRIREEGALAPDVCRQVVAALAADARETRSIEWLSEKAFTPGGWLHAREIVPGRRKPAQKPGPKARAGAIGAATPRHDHGTESRPAREVL
ncbi:MAG TPA: hypothetical protein VIV58_18755 [Kofleriaceae bacterium]